MLWALFVVLAVASQSNMNSCLHLEQSHNQRGQRQPVQMKNSLGEIPLDESYDAYSGEQLMNLYQQQFSNNNNKRARKMSAFMPMRGRKDGQAMLAIKPRLSALESGYTNERASEKEEGIDGAIERLISALFSDEQQPKFALSSSRPTMSKLYRINDLGPDNKLYAGAELFVQPKTNIDDRFRSTLKEAPLARWQRAFAPMRGKKSTDLQDDASPEV